jgi:hypothetical protein
MTASRYKTPENFLFAYHTSRGESMPGPDAFQWLRSCAERGFQVSADSFEYAGTLLNRATIDVDDVAENFLGLDLFLNDLRGLDSAADAPVFGFAKPSSGTINVCFRAEAYRPLYRSTVMHEVAHMMLHAEGRQTTLRYSPNSKMRPKVEREADRFMAETLLPKSILYLAIVLASQSTGIESGEAFRGANTRRGHWQWRHIFFPFFLNRLCLSRELVALRMLELGAFSRETLGHHKTYPIPNRWRRPVDLALGAIARDAFDSLSGIKSNSMRARSQREK